jgi:probable blue pigment (indigoidine) exporter
MKSAAAADRAAADTVIGSSIAGRDIAALVLAAVCWGLGTVVSKAALAEIPAVSLLTIQLAASLVTLTALMHWQGIPLRGGAPPLLGRLGLLNPGLAYALGLIGLMTISASVSVLLWALEPLMILLLAGLFLRERITPTLIAMSVLAVGGMLLVVYEPTSVGGQVQGVALTLAGIACCAAYTVITRRFIPHARETSQVVLSQQAYGLVLALGLVAVVGLLGGDLVPTAISPLGLASGVLSGVLYYAAAYWLYLGALRRVPASIAAASFYLIPIVGVTAGALLLGERLGPSQWIGALVVLASVLGILGRTTPTSVPIARPTQG